MQRSVIADNGECRLWTKGRTKQGYGQANWLGPDWMRCSKPFLAHRLAMCLKLGRMDLSQGSDDLCVSHRCHNKVCINGDHLSLEPRAVNNEREPCVRGK